MSEGILDQSLELKAVFHATETFKKREKPNMAIKNKGNEE
jgi:hypothetical protein